MTNSVTASHTFKREVKPLAKKYHTLKKSVDTLIEELIEDPYLGMHMATTSIKSD
jgi:mRNA-degrading endonuclease YafQ of YafQ-DinJ toxin-antitoxin module